MPKLEEGRTFRHFAFFCLTLEMIEQRIRAVDVHQRKTLIRRDQKKTNIWKFVGFVAVLFIFNEECVPYSVFSVVRVLSEYKVTTHYSSLFISNKLLVKKNLFNRTFSLFFVLQTKNQLD